MTKNKRRSLNLEQRSDNDVLQSIDKKLDLIVEILEKLSKAPKSVEVTNTKENSPLLSNISEVFINLNTNMTKIVEKLNCDIAINKESLKETIDQNQKKFVENKNIPFNNRIAKKDYKDKIQEKWLTMARNRERTFEQAFNNTKNNELYNEWATTDPPFLPKKFDIKPIKGEPDNQRNLRLSLAFKKMKVESQLMTLRAEEQIKKYQEIDNEMKSLIIQETPEGIAKMLIKEWNDEMKYGEERVLNSWNSKEKLNINQEKSEEGSDENEEANRHLPTNKKPSTNNIRESLAKMDNQYVGSEKRNNYGPHSNNHNNYGNNYSRPYSNKDYSRSHSNKNYSMPYRSQQEYYPNRNGQVFLEKGIPRSHQQDYVKHHYFLPKYKTHHHNTPEYWN